MNFAVSSTAPCRNHAAQPPKATHQDKNHRGESEEDHADDDVMPCEDRGLVKHWLLCRNFRRISSLRMNYLCGVRGGDRRSGSAVVRVLRVNIFIRMTDFTQEGSQLELGMEGYLFAICINLKRELRIEI